MDQKYLKATQYSWEKDPRKLRVNGLIPAGRCLHCACIFLNAANGIVFCSMCDKAMSMCKLGVDHDYDSFGPRIAVKDPTKAHLPKDQQTKSINLLIQREVRSPVEFNEEHLYFDKNNKESGEPPHFVTAAGKIIPTTETEEPETEDEYNDSELYKLR